MIDDETAFWRSIVANPDSDLERLIYADYLDEHGDPLGALLRECVAEGRRPGVFPDGGAWWVTTTSDPCAERAIRVGRQHVYNLIRPQPSWLAGFYWRFLAAQHKLLPFVRSGTVWRYFAVEDAYRDLLSAQTLMRKDMIDPKTGRSAFHGLTGSHWRDEARRAITVALAALPPDADERAKARAVRESFPFGQRKGHPYKMFRKEARLALGLTASRRAPAAVTEVSLFD